MFNILLIVSLDFIEFQDRANQCWTLSTLNYDDKNIFNVVGSFRNLSECAVLLKLFRLNQALITTRGHVARISNIQCADMTNRYIVSIMFGAKIVNYQDLLFEVVKNNTVHSVFDHFIVSSDYRVWSFHKYDKGNRCRPAFS